MDKYALVTGSSRGIGRAIALQLAKDGFNIFVHYKSNKEKAEEIKREIEEIGVKAFSIKADITKDSERKDIISEVQKISNHLDVLVNNVGFDYANMIEDYKYDEIAYMLESNLTHKMMMSIYALPLLKKSDKATIINIASRMGKEKTIATVGAYAPSEAGVIKFTQCCALEWGKYKIRVNCVAPGLTRTDMTESLFKTEEEWNDFAKKNPSGRVGKPQDVANVVSFLVSEKSEYINGETLGVNGGSNLG